MKIIALSVACLFAMTSVPTLAVEISTHVLDLARGIGGAAVPVTLSKRDTSGSWVQVGTGSTDSNGRIRSFGESKQFGAGIYRLNFDMTRYPDAAAMPFFPEISLTFQVSDNAGHYHVPVVVSPFGYSTYRGN